VGSSEVNPALVKYVLTSDKATCFIVPLSFVTTLSASTNVVEEADVSPSMMFNSVAVEVTPSRIFNSAVVDVTPSKIFNSVAVDVTPSSMLSSAAVEVTFVPPISSVVTDISPATVAIPSANVIKSVSSV